MDQQLFIEIKEATIFKIYGRFAKLLKYATLLKFAVMFAVGIGIISLALNDYYPFATLIMIHVFLILGIVISIFSILSVSFDLKVSQLSRKYREPLKKISDLVVQIHGTN